MPISIAPAPVAPTDVDRVPHKVEAFFARLGECIAADLGTDRDRIQAHLEGVAMARLAEFEPWRHITHDDLVDYVLGARKLPKQIDMEAKFAEPPLSLYHAEHFDISALTWLDGTTSIHQHSFCGAFQVLSGSSIHSRYRFSADAEPQLLQRSCTGSLELVDIEVLRPGDTRPITRGFALIHALFHMIRPSITIVVRTTTDDNAREVQYDFRWPGIAFDPFQNHAATHRKMQYLDMLRALHGRDADPHLHRVLADADLHLAYRLLSQDFQRHRDPDRARGLTATCAALTPRERDLAARAAHNDFVSQVLIDLRRRLHDPAHRFLLALLLNVFDRDWLLDLVRSEHATDDPVGVIRKWMAEMCGCTDRFPNLLGLAMNETALDVLDSLWLGQSEATMLDTFAARFGDAAVRGQADVLKSLRQALRDCPLFFQVFRSLET